MTESDVGAYYPKSFVHEISCTDCESMHDISLGIRQKRMFKYPIFSGNDYLKHIHSCQITTLLIRVVSHKIVYAQFLQIEIPEVTVVLH